MDPIKFSDTDEKSDFTKTSPLIKYYRILNPENSGKIELRKDFIPKILQRRNPNLKNHKFDLNQFLQDARPINPRELRKNITPNRSGSGSVKTDLRRTPRLTSKHNEATRITVPNNIDVKYN